jgi:hypothetical protein
MRGRRIVLGLASIGLALGCGQGERERGDPYFEPELKAAAPPIEPPPPPKTYAEHLADVPGGASEQATLEALLYDYCGDCHASDSDPVTDGAGMDYVDDIDRLIETGTIIPGDPADSKLVRRMLRAEMPPPSAGLPPAPQELIERLSAFVQSLPPAPIQR